MDEQDPLDQICWFKKHEGEPWRDVVETDPDYVHFILYETNLRLDQQLVEALEMELGE